MLLRLGRLAAFPFLLAALLCSPTTAALAQTPAPTPGSQLVITASTGAEIVIQRTFTYGDLLLAGLLLVILGVFMLWAFNHNRVMSQ